MLLYILRKLITLLVVLFIIATVGFCLIYFMDGTSLSPMPLPEAYAHFFQSLFSHFLPTDSDLNSFYPTLQRALPSTLQLCCLATLLALLIAIPLGIYAGLYPNRPQTKAIQTICLLLGASPLVWLAVLVIFLASGLPQLLPSFGSQIEHLNPITGFSLLDILLAPQIDTWHELGIELQYLALPTLILAIQPTIVGTQLISQSITTVAGQNYIKAALMREPSLHRVLLKHILPNALPSTIPSLSYNFNLLLFCAMVIEIIFQRQGLGTWIMQAYQHNSISELTMLMILCSILISLLNMVSDILTMLLLPLRQKALYGQR